MAFTKQRWFIGGLVALGVLLLFSEHGRQVTGDVGGLTGTRQICSVTVTADAPVRTDAYDIAGVVGTLNLGAVVLAENTVRNGYRQLGPGLWVAEAKLNRTPGTDCG